MAEIRVNATGGLKLFDADDSHYAQIIAGTITSNVDVLTLGHASADFNIPVKVLGTTPTLTIGDAGAEDTKIVFDGNAQDFYIGLDDSADDLLIGVGSAVGTTPALAIDENAGSTFSGTVTVGVDDTGKDVKLFGATSGSYMLWDESADDLNLIASGLGVTTAKDLGVGVHIRTADSGGSVDANCDELVIENSGGCGLTILSGTSNLGRIAFGDSGAAMNGRVQYDHTNDSLDFYTSGTEHMSIDSTGAVTKPLQPAFYAEISGGNQDNIAINTATTVLLNSEVFDVNADFNTGTYTFTAPVTGKYHFSVKLACNNVDEGASYYDLILSTSNKAIYLGSWAFNGYDADATYFSLVGSCTCDMDTSDTALVTLTQGGGTAQTDLNNGTYMTGHLAC